MGSMRCCCALLVFFPVASALIAKRLVEQATASAAAGPLRVWIDIGTSYRSLATWDLENNSSLLVVGADALRSNLENAQQSKSSRFIRVEGACSAAAVSTLNFNVHASPTCGSLLSTSRSAPPLGSGRDACTGDTPRVVQVPVFRMSALIHRLRTLLPRDHLIELLKIDIQGSELDCLRSGAAELSRVANILLEVQDVRNNSKLSMYEGAPTLGALDAYLHSHGFRRQYCEWNRWTRQIREINCLYSNDALHDTWLWATGNSRRSDSIVSYVRRVPPFIDLVRHLHTSNFTGDRLRERARDGRHEGQRAGQGGRAHPGPHPSRGGDGRSRHLGSA